MQQTKIWATVLEVSESKIKVKFDNGQTSSKYYRHPKGYTPVEGDRALFDSDICIGIY
jgi:hypothetical protein